MNSRYTYCERIRNRKAEAVASVRKTLYADIFEIDTIDVRPKRFCGMGLGSKLMKLICEAADIEEVILQLIEAPDLGKKKELRRFYVRHGFKDTGKRYRHSLAILKREPK